MPQSGESLVKSLPKGGLRLVLCVLTLGLITLGGCDQTGDLAEASRGAKGTRLVLAHSPAGRLLEETAAAYQRLQSYQDAGRVVLSYKFDGESTADVAPLAVALERPSKLGLRAYSVVAGLEQDRWRMRVGDGQDSPLPRQVVSRALPAKLDLNWLMVDELAAEYLSAGLAGAPPQLELLMGFDPFRGLIENATALSIAGTLVINGESCTVVNVVSGEATTRLCISLRDHLLRRIELPTPALPPAMLSDKRISDIRLTIEFDSVQAKGAIDWSQWHVPPQPRDQLVRHFVPRPIELADPRLGKTVPAFRLTSPSGAVSVDTSSEAQRGRTQVFIWAADHPSCQSTLQQIKTALDQLPPKIADRVAPTVVWAEGTLPEGLSFETLPSAWKFPYPLVSDQTAIGRDVFGINEAPSVAVLDSKHRLQFFQQRANVALPAKLEDVLTRLDAGENLAEAVAKQSRIADERFSAQLWLARAQDATVDSFQVPQAYPPQLLTMRETSRTESDSKIMALATDKDQSLWLLRADGSVERMAADGKKQKTWRTEWKLAEDANVRLQVSSNARYIACAKYGEATLQLLDTESQVSSTASLGEGQSVIDFQWMTATGATSPKLAAITAKGRTVLIDPEQSQQFSGYSATSPLAILTNNAPVSNNARAVDGGAVVLADGLIEPLLLSGAECEANPKSLAQPVSVKLGDKLAEQKGSQGDAQPSRVLFQPGAGPWSFWHDGKTVATLARGWIAPDEPALFMLDSQLRQLWHVPVPISKQSEWPLVSVARDPVSGQPLWVVAQPNETLHFMRADGQVVDHCQLEQPVAGLAVVPVGSELHLLIAHPKTLVRYQLTTRP